MGGVLLRFIFGEADFYLLGLEIRSMALDLVGPWSGWFFRGGHGSRPRAEYARLNGWAVVLPQGFSGPCRSSWPWSLFWWHSDSWSDHINFFLVPDMREPRGHGRTRLDTRDHPDRRAQGLVGESRDLVFLRTLMPSNAIRYTEAAKRMWSQPITPMPSNDRNSLIPGP